MRGVIKHSGKVRTIGRKWVPSVDAVFAVNTPRALRGGVAWLRSARQPLSESPLYGDRAHLEAIPIGPAASSGCPASPAGPPVGGLRLWTRVIDSVLKTRA